MAESEEEEMKRGSEYEINKDALPKQEIYRITVDDLETLEHHKGAPIITSDFQIVEFEADPGTPEGRRTWHYHMPDKYQILYGLEGKLEVEYRDGEDQIRVATLNPGQVLYKPGGIEHKTEVVGDETHRHLIIFPRVQVGRINELLGEDDRVRNYSTIEDRVGLWFDNVSDTEIKKDESAVEINPDDSE